MIQAHPTAVISDKAELGAGVEVGPYSVIGPHVRIGAGTVIGAHVQIDGDTVIGERNEIFNGACIGMPAQMKSYRQIKNAKLTIGDENVIREQVTINSGGKDGATTVVGDRNFLMITSHVAHDCVLGNDIILANGTMLGGHATVDDGAVLGGLVGVHQFCHVGRLTMIGGLTRVVMDVPPFTMCAGIASKIFGLNLVGLKRAGYSLKDTAPIKSAVKTLLDPAIKLADAIETVSREYKGNKDIEYLIAFVKNSKRGIPRGVIHPEEGEF